ncbi:restriction endonuclease subunit S [Streptomyces sp. SID12501]|uniref:Type I restriction modification DNA specificity domain-containing protein n=1 Tax=Streptomyces sp. SID12501 TaxID=2706042 RepID=A0A6B3BMV8_9ACTN|nr:restriction endonuclease subunit S [Streptomyces sp. SID12501]NEC85646.1 hypothetical protein [Streptomyces sp. SID12501]
MRELAPGWTWSRVGDLFDMQLGKMLSKEASAGLEQRQYLTNKNVQWNRIDFEALNYMSFSSAEREKFRLGQGDLLVTEGGEVGRTAIWQGERDECYFQKSLHRLRSRGQIDPRYMLHYMNYAARWQMFTDSVGQTSIAHLPQDKFAEHLVVHPADLAEQRRIVEVIENFSALERGVEASIAKLQSVRQGALLDSMSRIQPEWAPVRDLGEVRMGKQLSPASRMGAGQWPYLRVANVYEGRIDYSDVNAMAFSAAERDTYGLMSGDILLNEGQENLMMVGRSALYDGAPGEFGFQNTLIRFRPGPAVVPEFAQAVFVWWRMNAVFAGIAEKTSISHLGGSRFGALLFPLIPVAAQRRIVESLDAVEDQRLTEVAELSKLRRLKQGFMDDLLSGRVVVSAVAV